MRLLRWSPPSFCASYYRYLGYSPRVLQCCRYQSRLSQVVEEDGVTALKPTDSFQGEDGRVTFVDVGVPKPIAHALPQAFPNVEHPTSTQQQLISAVLGGKDVFLQDPTGTGKSFGLVLALLSKGWTQKSVFPEHGQWKRTGPPAIGTLLIVPHRDLAYQFIHWIELIHSAMRRPEVLAQTAQVIVRNKEIPLAEQLALLHAHTPHMVIGTPPALLDVLEKDPQVLMLDSLKTVVVDEADYVIEGTPNNTNARARIKALQQIKKHPSPARQILDQIWKIKRKFDFIKGEEQISTGIIRGGPQIIVSSTTLRADYRRSLLKSGWFNKGPHSWAKIPEVVDQKSIPEDDDRCRIGDGSAANIQMATGENRSETQPSADHQTDIAPDSEAVGLMEEMAPNLPFNSHALEVIAEAFALDVPSLALLVLPASAPLLEVVTALRGFGVNAHGLNIHASETRNAFLMHNSADPPTDSPVLLVSTLASTRGIDLPHLTHVFILGVPEDRPVDTYVHAAGRVGRFGRSGKVVSVLEARHLTAMKRGKPGWKDEPKKMREVFKMMGVRPTKLDHFS